MYKRAIYRFLVLHFTRYGIPTTSLKVTLSNEREQTLTFERGKKKKLWMLYVCMCLFKYYTRHLRSNCLLYSISELCEAGGEGEAYTPATSLLSPRLLLLPTYVVCNANFQTPNGRAFCEMHFSRGRVLIAVAPPGRWGGHFLFAPLPCIIPSTITTSI